jgi:hypothetical protein
LHTPTSEGRHFREWNYKLMVICIFHFDDYWGWVHSSVVEHMLAHTKPLVQLPASKKKSKNPKIMKEPLSKLF